MESRSSQDNELLHVCHAGDVTATVDNDISIQGLPGTGFNRAPVGTIGKARICQTLEQGVGSSGA